MYRAARSFFFFFFLWHALVSEGLWNSQSKFHFLSCSKEIFAGPCFLKVKLAVKGSNGGSIGCQRAGEWPLNKDHITPEYSASKGKGRGPSLMERPCPEAPAMCFHTEAGVGLKAKITFKLFTTLKIWKLNLWVIIKEWLWFKAPQAIWLLDGVQNSCVGEGEPGSKPCSRWGGRKQDPEGLLCF